MGKFDGYLICSDCDGTLTDSQRRFSKENSDAIKYFQSEGGLFTVSSGRYPHYIEEFARYFVPNTYVIGCNGAVLYDLKKNETVYHRPIAHPINEMLKDIHSNMPWVKSVIISGTVDQYYHYVRKSDPVPDWMKGTTGVDTDILAIETPEEIDSLLAKAPGDIIRLLFTHDDEEGTKKTRATLREKYGHKYRFVMSWELGLEVMDANWGKGEMINHMRTLIPGIHTTVGVGDYENDVSMLDLCDISYAVDNAPDYIKAHADRITVSCNESAIARIIQEIEDNL